MTEEIYVSAFDSVLFVEQMKANTINVETAVAVANSMLRYLVKLSHQDPYKYHLVMTLNQICDSRYFSFLNQSGSMKALCKLIDANMFHVSTYGGGSLNECYGLTAYTIHSLENCLKRLAENVVEDDEAFISSLLPSLGKTNTGSLQRREIGTLIGVGKDIFVDKGTLYTDAELQNPITLAELRDTVMHTYRYGYLTYLLAYAAAYKNQDAEMMRTLTELPIDRFAIKYGINTVPDKEDCDTFLLFKTWTCRLCETDAYMRKKSVYQKNKSVFELVDKPKTVQTILVGMANNETLIADNIRKMMWKKRIDPEIQQIVIDRIIVLLRKLSNTRENRSGMYHRIYYLMKEMYEHLQEESLQIQPSMELDLLQKAAKYFQKEGGSYQKTVLTLQTIINKAYNIFNAFVSVGVLINKAEKQISCTMIQFDSNAKKFKKIKYLYKTDVLLISNESDMEDIAVDKIGEGQAIC